MKPAKLDLPTIWRGCDWGPITFKWKDQNGNPINLVPYSAIVQSLNINLNPTKTNAAQGVTTLSLTREQTLHLKLGVENWDWMWQTGTAGAGMRYPPFLSGKVTIKEPVGVVFGDPGPGSPSAESLASAAEEEIPGNGAEED